MACVAGTEIASNKILIRLTGLALTIALFGPQQKN